MSSCPGFSSNQESTQILDDLDDFDALPRQPHSPYAPCLNFCPVENADNSANANHSLGVREYRQHDPQQRITIEY